VTLGKRKCGGFWQGVISSMIMWDAVPYSKRTMGGSMAEWPLFSNCPSPRVLFRVAMRPAASASKVVIGSDTVEASL